MDNIEVIGKEISYYGGGDIGGRGIITNKLIPIYKQYKVITTDHTKERDTKYFLVKNLTRVNWWGDYTIVRPFLSWQNNTLKICWEMVHYFEPKNDTDDVWDEWKKEGFRVESNA